jgi:hypothetical protein
MTVKKSEDWTKVLAAEIKASLLEDDKFIKELADAMVNNGAFEEDIAEAVEDAISELNFEVNVT